jgi:hypothetical protein
MSYHTYLTRNIISSLNKLALRLRPFCIVLANKLVPVLLVAVIIALENALPAVAQAQTSKPTAVLNNNKDLSQIKHSTLEKHIGKIVQVLSAPDPKLSASPSSGPVGSFINLKGSDFPPYTSLNIAIGRVNSEAGGNYGSTVTTSAGTFEVRIILEAPSSQQPIPAGEIILLAHNLDYSIKALTTFQVTASSTPSAGFEQVQGAMPGAVPPAGLGYKASLKWSDEVLPLPSILVLGVLIILATTSMLILFKSTRPKARDKDAK